MAELVEIVPWQESPPLMEKLRECVATSDNFRAWMQMPEWVTFRWRPFTKIFIATLRDSQSGDLLAVTPLVEHKEPLGFSIAGQGLATVRVSGLLLNGNVPLFPCSDEYYEALCRAALEMPSVDCLYILGVPKISPFWRFLTKAQKTHPQWLFYTPGYECYRYFYIDMTTSYDEYLRKFKATTRQKFRGRLRQLEKEVGGRLDLVRVRDAADVPQFLAAAHAIAKKSWQRGLIGFDVDQPANRQDLLESMARQGVLRSYLLRSGEKVFAFLVGFQSNGVYYAHETAFDEAYACTRFSPGQLLFYLVIKDCFEINKPNIFHFGPGEYWYKGLFANQSGEEVAIMILKNSAANRVKVTAHRLFRKSIEMIKSGIAGKVPATQKRS
jgi:hypothetical protein